MVRVGHVLLSNPFVQNEELLLSSRPDTRQLLDLLVAAEPKPTEYLIKCRKRTGDVERHHV